MIKLEINNITKPWRVNVEKSYDLNPTINKFQDKMFFAIYPLVRGGLWLCGKQLTKHNLR